MSTNVIICKKNRRFLFGLNKKADSSPQKKGILSAYTISIFIRHSTYGWDRRLGFFPLPRVKEVQPVIDSVQYGSFIKAPGRIYEDRTGSVSCKAVNGYLRRNQLQTFDH